MTDQKKREKVIKGLGCCSSEEDKCLVCPYYGVCYVTQKFPFWALFADAIALLEEQEPITPHMVDWGIYECPKCKTRVDKTYNFCKCCGRPVKWDG